MQIVIENVSILKFLSVCVYIPAFELYYSRYMVHIEYTYIFSYNLRTYIYIWQKGNFEYKYTQVQFIYTYTIYKFLYPRTCGIIFVYVIEIFKTYNFPANFIVYFYKSLFDYYQFIMYKKDRHSRRYK